MTLFWVGVIVVISHAAEAVTGFGCTVLALPFVAALLGLNEAVMLLAVLAWIIALYFAIAKWRQIHFRQYLVIAGLAGLGLPLGLCLPRVLSREVLTRVLAWFIIAMALLQLLRSLLPPKWTRRQWPLTVCGIFPFLGGVIHGAFASGGPLVVLYASRALPDKGRFRATLCLLWATLNTALMIHFALESRFTPAFLARLGFMLPFLAAGMVAGELIHRRVNAEVFRKTIFALLLTVGLVMLITTFRVIKP